MENHAASDTTDVEWSMFQVKYVEFVEDALGALPEYQNELMAAKGLEEKVRLARFQAEVHIPQESSGDEKEERPNPGTILPGVTLSDTVWSSLSQGTQHAIEEHLRILSICSMMESVG